MSKSAYHHIAKPPAEGAPLVFTFHGTGGDEHQFPGLVEQILPEAGIVSPQGDVWEYGAARFFRRTGEGIYDMDDLAARAQKMRGSSRRTRIRVPVRLSTGWAIRTAQTSWPPSSSRHPSCSTGWC